MRRKIRPRILLLLGLVLSLTMVSTRLQANTGTCGGASLTLPFTDVSGSSVFFCAIAEAFITGLSNGTTATTYSPGANVTRDQMAAFITRTHDSAIRRSSRRAALGQWWTPQHADDLSRSIIAVGTTPRLIASDGADIWVAHGPGILGHRVMRVRASDGKILETWTGAGEAYGVVVAGGRVFVAGNGSIFSIDPKQPPGAVAVFANLGAIAHGITFDGRHLWTANTNGSISRVHIKTQMVSNFSTGFARPEGILFDGTSLWVTDIGDDTLKKVDVNGVITQTIAVGTDPHHPAFDGTNLWVPNRGSVSVTVVRAATGQVLATLTGNGLDEPISAAFDGERILVTSVRGVSLWKAADLTPLISFFITGTSFGACSDGVNFWFTLSSNNRLVRF